MVRRRQAELEKAMYFWGLRRFPPNRSGEIHASRYSAKPVVTIFVRYAMSGEVAMLTQACGSARGATGGLAFAGIGHHGQRV